MRLDLYLKTSRLIVRRSLAQKFCDAGLVAVNGVAAKSSKIISEGDEIEIRRHNRLTKVRVRLVPGKKQVSKQDASNLYEMISETELDDELLG